MTREHYIFCTLKEQYLKATDEAEKEWFLNEMKENLLLRNDGNPEIELNFPRGESIDILATNDYRAIFTAESSLNTQGK